MYWKCPVKTLAYFRNRLCHFCYQDYHQHDGTFLGGGGGGVFNKFRYHVDNSLKTCKFWRIVHKSEMCGEAFTQHGSYLVLPS